MPKKEKEPAYQHRGHKRRDLNPWVRKSPGGWHSNPLQYFWLETPMDRGPWRATVYESQRAGHD